MKRRALQLEFEIFHYTPVIFDEDMIDSMTFTASSGENVKDGQASDKTANIAISYSDKAKRINMKHSQELESELISLRLHLERLEYYISILDEKHSSVLHNLYIKGMTFIEAAEADNFSITALKNCRKAGIKKLADMLNAVSNG